MKRIKRNKYIMIGFSPEEKGVIEKACQKAFTSQAHFIRMASLKVAQDLLNGEKELL